jgi:hypothetical protein
MCRLASLAVRRAGASVARKPLRGFSFGLTLLEDVNAGP